MARVDLKALLEDKEEGLLIGQRLCPYMTRMDISQGRLDPHPKLAAMVVVCVGKLCGSYNRCFNVIENENASK